MRDRTFHKRTTLPVRLGMGLFTALVVYFFWVKTAILGILVAIVIVGMIERILHHPPCETHRPRRGDGLPYHRRGTFLHEPQCAVVRCGEGGEHTVLLRSRSLPAHRIWSWQHGDGSARQRGGNEKGNSGENWGKLIWKFFGELRS